MKGFLLPFFAVVLTFIFGSFTRKFTTVYLIHGAGPEDSYYSYYQTLTNPGTAPGNTLWWIKVIDNDGTVTQWEFQNIYFPAEDTNSDGNLSDETETSRLEKRDFE